MDDIGGFTYNGMSEAPVWWTSYHVAFDKEDRYVISTVLCKNSTGTTVRSGDAFQVGTNTTVTCSATDSDGNVGQCEYSFAVIGKTMHVHMCMLGKVKCRAIKSKVKEISKQTSSCNVPKDH